jgi:hypothetical protein
MILVACGAKKRTEPARARDLYTGPYFKAALAYALELSPPRDVFILSAKYGIVGPDDMLEPYDLKVGQPGAITSIGLSDQAEVYGMLKETVVVIGGALYVGLCRKVWRDVEAPLAGKGGLGKQIAWMRKVVENAESKTAKTTA